MGEISWEAEDDLLLGFQQSHLQYWGCGSRLPKMPSRLLLDRRGAVVGKAFQEKIATPDLKAWLR